MQIVGFDLEDNTDKLKGESYGFRMDSKFKGVCDF